MGWCFTALALTGLFVFLFGRSLKTRRVVIWMNVGLPALILGRYAFILPVVAVFGPYLLLLAAAGQADGEVWSEFFVFYSSLGSWTTLWLVVAIARFLKIGESSKKVVNAAEQCDATNANS